MADVLTPPDAPGIPVDVLVQQPAIIASPAPITFQLPRQGFYLFTFLGYVSNQDNPECITGTTSWFKFVNNLLVKTSLIGAGGFGGQPSGIAVSDPSSTGVVTVTTTYTGGNSAVGGRLILRTLASASELNTAQQ